jgi:hypothetical protein
MGRARDLANILSSSGNVALDSEMGLSLITPTSVAASGGSATISSTGTVSFTSASAISLNGVFNSTYENYRILLRITAQGTSNGAHNLRMRSNSTDASGNDYFAGGIYNYANSSTVSANQMNAASNFNVGDSITSATGTWYSIDFFNPFVSQKTGINVNGWAENTTYSYGHVRNGTHNLTTPYDGFSLISSAGTFTGTVSVYGYRK